MLCEGLCLLGRDAFVTIWGIRDTQGKKLVCGCSALKAVCLDACFSMIFWKQIDPEYVRILTLCNEELSKIELKTDLDVYEIGSCLSFK